MALADGRIETVRFDCAYDEARGAPLRRAPVVEVDKEGLELLVPQSGKASETSHPVPFGGGLLTVAGHCRLLAEPGGELPVPELPNVHPMLSGDGKVAMLSEPTEHYVYGILATV